MLDEEEETLIKQNITFQDKRDYEVERHLVETRSENSKFSKRLKELSSEWEVEPIDFSWKLYHPKPLKRNTKDAIKPWLYDKYLREVDENERAELPTKKTVESQMLQGVFADTVEDQRLNAEDFQRSFRVLTPNGARKEAARNMGFREGLTMFKNQNKHDFRGLQDLFGMSDFKTRFEKDPNNVKFLTKNLNFLHGLSRGQSLRDVFEFEQMGDAVKKKEPQYDPSLILPNLPFPNKFNGFTRHRRRDRSVENAYWDRVLPKINEKWPQE